jgi:hypothetical protein
VSPYVLARARRLGIPNPEQKDAATLESWLEWADAQHQKVGAVQPPAVPEEPPEVPFDWGKDDDGPFTEERLKTQFPMLHRVKEYADRKFAAAEKLNKKVQEQLEQQARERGRRQFDREVIKRLATHPEVFGEKPHEATGVQAERVKMVRARLAEIGVESQRQNLDHLDEDLARAMSVFVEAKPEGKGQPPRASEGAPPSRTTTAADLYRQAELARPTDRRNLQTLTKREALLKQEAERLRENGVAVAPDFGEDDDADLMPEM